MIVVDLTESEPVRHLESADRPLCGARADGALIVEKRGHATCLACLMMASWRAVGPATA